MVVTGGCLCGNVRYAAQGTPSAVHVCHCSMCRRATGGPFVVLVWFRQDEVRWDDAAPRTYRSSPIAERGFCASCGAPIFLRYDEGDDIGLLVGGLDAPEPFPPGLHYGVESRIPWAEGFAPGLPEKVTQEVF